MNVEFIGYVGAQLSSEIHPPQGSAIDLAHIEAAAHVHEAAGFDRVLVASHSTGPDSTLVAAYTALKTSRLGLMIAHRPGFIAPTVAARQFATLDHLTGGRVAIHIITGGDDTELAQDGSYINKDERYARTDEYLDVMIQEWSSLQPFDHQGPYYKYDKAFSFVKPLLDKTLPIYFGGSSSAAIEVAGKHADIYALWGETLAQVQAALTEVRASAARYGRSPRFSLSLRPIIAETEEEAWARASHILESARAISQKSGVSEAHQPQNAGSQRLLEAAAKGKRLDKRLWTEMAALTGARGNSTSLVGTPEQVAEAMLDYYDLGITTFLIRGYDPLEDAKAYGRELIPRFKALLAARSAQSSVAAE